MRFCLMLHVMRGEKRMGLLNKIKALSVMVAGIWSLSKAYWQKAYLSAKRVLQPEHLARNP